MEASIATTVIVGKSSLVAYGLGTHSPSRCLQTRTVAVTRVMHALEEKAGRDKRAGRENVCATRPPLRHCELTLNSFFSQLLSRHTQ